ncbi:MAG: hypothetical protein OXG72_16380 [Acidobacteria bacterium]|nr:hypothetical protein [Acidobacteriota bacterium]
MRTRTIAATVLAVAIVALSALGATPAAAQTPDPPDPVLGLQYNLMNTRSVELHEWTVDHATRILGNHGRGPTNTGFVAANTRSQMPTAFGTPNPPDPVLGLQYNLMNAGSAKLHGAAVDYDTPIFGEHLRLAAGGAYVTGDSLDHLFAGAGPGVRHDTGTFQLYAHALFGYRRDMATKGFDGRFSAGIDWPLGSDRSFRAGAAYSGDVHVTAGMSFRF